MTAEGVALDGLSRTATWLALVGSAGTILAARAATRRVAWAAWLIPLLGVALAVVRMPVALVGILLLAALLLPRVTTLPASAGWARTLVAASLAGVGMIAAGAGGRQHGDETIAGLVIVGFLMAAGMVPFGWHMLRWLEEAPKEQAALVVSALLPGVVAALVAAQPVLTAVHEAPRAGMLLGGFGAATAVAGGLYALAARDWRALATRTVPGEVGLALVGVAAFDIRGLQAAALTLAVLACTRPALLFADDLGARRGAGRVVTIAALLGAAGLPPSLGFPARLLLLSAAVRVHPAVAGLVVVGMVLELIAIAAVLRRRLDRPPEVRGAPATRSLRLLGVLTVMVLLGGGVFPGLLVRRVFDLAG